MVWHRFSEGPGTARRGQGFWFALPDLVVRVAAAGERRNGQCRMAILALMSIAALALSCQGFFGGPLPLASLDSRASGRGKWVCLALAIGLAALTSIYQRFKTCRTYAFATAATGVGAALPILDHKPGVGWVVICVALPLALSITLLENAGFRYSGGLSTSTPASSSAVTRSSS